MAGMHMVGVDLVTAYRTVTERGGRATKEVATVLAWGDRVQVQKATKDRIDIRLWASERHEDDSVETSRGDAFILVPKGRRPEEILVPWKDRPRVLQVDFVDVQQGDGMVIETPEGKVVLVDGGDNQLFARYLAGRFPGTTATRPKQVDCIVVTHGDADHFAGLLKIHESETAELDSWKRLFIHPQRVYHNGLVKGPATRNGKRVPEQELFGKTAVVKDPESGKAVTVVTGLCENLLSVPASEMNDPFKAWQDVLKAYKRRGGITFRRLERGDDEAFDFLREEGVDTRVLGPIPTRVGATTGLRFLGNPPKGPRIGHESLSGATGGFGGVSASHTINGHSVILRVSFGQFSFMLSGDLNDEAGRILANAHGRGDVNLRSEVFKVPHHGSADFSGAFIQAVSPVVSVVSSGDESARKEYIHPRATLVGALGRYSRMEEPLVFVTELVAFFKVEGWIDPKDYAPTEVGKATLKKRTKGQSPTVNLPERGRFFSFSRAAFGSVMVRTDGGRLLVFTDSGQVKLKEAYAYVADSAGRITPAPVVKI